MTRQENIARLETEATIARDRSDKYNAWIDSQDTWIKAYEIESDRLHLEAFAVEDKLATARAEYYLENIAFRDLVIARFEPLPNGPTYPGDPIVTVNGADYFADDVNDLAQAYNIGA